MFEPLCDALGRIEGFDLARLIKVCRAIKDTGRVFFIGNGGSAAIASHMAADWLKNGSFAALAFNDAPALTCISNDLAFRHVFALPLTLHADADDVLFAVSSSGGSDNIVSAAQWAKRSGLFVVTLSGFEPNNPLRSAGDVNIYVPSSSYGVVEISHLAVLHELLDELTS